MKRMLYNHIFRSRRLLILFVLLIVLIIVKKFYSRSLSNNVQTVLNTRSFNHDRAIKERKINKKIVEINDRQPSFKLYIYDGYEINLDRNRAQAKLLDNIKLHDKCQQEPKTIIVDIGASLGQFGLYAAACGCQVYMFEVDPIKLSLLEMSIKLNSLESRITLIPKAVTDLPLDNKIYMSSNTSSQVSSNDLKDQSNIYSVEPTNLNQYNFSSDIYFLRVDVEGYEIHVIRACEKLFRLSLIHHVLFQFKPTGTDRVIQNDLLSYMRDILGGKRFYALHPKEAIIYGPLYNEDIDNFYTQHQAQNVERDVYVLFQDEDISIDSKTYEFQTSF